jgi:hypothetical protein
VRERGVRNFTREQFAAADRKAASA